MSFFDRERFIHSLKTAIACSVGYFISKIIGLPADQWVVITIIVVMCAQLYVGSVLQKAYLRFLGTIIGSLFAASTIALFGVSHVAITATIALSSFIFSYYAASSESNSYAGTLGAVTTAIIMLGQEPSLLYALERFLEIALGLVIATLASQFIFPIHARTHLRHLQAKTLLSMRNYFSLALTKTHTDNEIIELDESIVKTLLRQRQLAKESKGERLGIAFDPQHFMQSLYAEREILRAITFMHQALNHAPQLQTALISLPAWDVFQKPIVNALDVIIQSLNEDRYTTHHIHIPNIFTLKRAVNALETDEKIRLNLEGLLFSANILTANLRKLAQLFGIPAIDDV